MSDNRLYNRRKELGLTLEQVGNIVGVGKSTVRKWETGYIENMKRDKIELLAKALQTTPLFIMGIDESINENTDISEFEKSLINKYRVLDEKGKHAVNDMLELQYRRVKTSAHLNVVAAHNDDTSEEQIELMQQDLNELKKLTQKKRDGGHS